MEADYSWLAMSPTSTERRTYEMPEMKRIELEQLCSRLHASDCGAVILTFRRAIDDQQPINAELVPTMLRSVISTVRYPDISLTYVNNGDILLQVDVMYLC